MPPLFSEFKKKENELVEIDLDTNDLYVQGGVNPEMAMLFEKAIRQFRAKYDNLVSKPALTLHICGPGGYSTAGFSMAESMLALNADGYKTVGILVGHVASASTFPYVACQVRKMHEGAKFLMHKAHMWTWGKDHEIEHALEGLKECDEQQVILYSKCLGKTKKQVRKMMGGDKDLWRNKAWCVKHGVVTED